MQSDTAHGRDDELVEEVARAIYEAEGGTAWERLYEPIEAAYWTIARRTLAVARQSIREECARVAMKEARELEIANATDGDTWAVQVRSGGIITAKDIAAAIRAME